MDVKICYLLAFLSEAVILYQYTSYIFKPKTQKKYNLISLFTLYLLLFFLSFFNNFWLNTIAFFICNSVYIYFLHETKYVLALFHSSITTVIMSMCELFISGILSFFFPSFFANVTLCQNVILLTMFSKVLYFFVLYLLSHFIIQRKKYSQYYDYTTIFLGLVPVSSCIVTLTIVKLCEQSTFSSNLDFMVILSAALLLATNIFIFSIHQYNQKKNMEFTELQLMIQKEEDIANYYGMLLKEMENRSILIHDIKKHLQSILILNENGEQKQVTSYIKQLQLSSGLKETYRLCDNQVLNSIVYRCQKECSNKNILFECDIRSNTVNFIDNNDITSIFCNLLDNATEAAVSTANPFIRLSIIKKENSAFIIITLVNSCQENPFSSSKKLYTKKIDKQKHGLGVKSIKHTIKKYNGEFKMYYDKNKMTFHTIIILKSIVN